MKRFYGILALAGALAMTSCSNDDIPSSGVNNSENEARAYINVQLSMPNLGTRADDDGNLNSTGDFAYGTKEENDINSLILGFYDNTGNVLELVNVPVTNRTHQTTADNIAVTEPIQVGVEDNTAEKAQTLLAFVNINMSDVTGKNLTQVQSATFSSYNPGNGFAMTNSGYYTGSTPAYTNVNTLTSDDFYTVGETSTNTVSIYVERVAVKVQLDKITEVSTYKVYNNEGTEVTLTFAPKGWDVQATSKESYILKQNAASIAENMSWVNPATTNYRSYWAQSYGYNTGDATFLPAGDATVDASLNTLLNYKNYSNISSGTFTGSSAPYTSSSTVYVLENTFPSTRLYNASTPVTYNPWSAVTSIVLAGTYTPGTGFTAVDGDNGFYLRSKTQMNSSQNGLEVVDQILSSEQVLGAMAQAASYITKQSGNTQVALTASDLKLAYVAGTNQTNPANYRFAQLASETGTYYINGVEASNAAVVNAELQKITPARYYNNGNAFFYIPLKHYVAGTTSPQNQYLNLEEVVEGNYGVVRNNCYVLTIKEIKGLGTGSGSDNDIPVPDPDDESYAIDAVLNVLQWHMRNQSVNL